MYFPYSKTLLFGSSNIYFQISFATTLKYKVNEKIKVMQYFKLASPFKKFCIKSVIEVLGNTITQFLTTLPYNYFFSDSNYIKILKDLEWKIEKRSIKDISKPFYQWLFSIPKEETNHLKNTVGEQLPQQIILFFLEEKNSSHAFKHGVLEIFSTHVSKSVFSTVEDSLGLPHMLASIGKNSMTYMIKDLAQYYSFDDNNTTDVSRIHTDYADL